MTITRRTFLAASAVTATTATTISFAQEDDAFPVRYAANVEMWWRKLSFIDRIHAAADAGFDVIEFWPWRGKDIDAIAQVCKERGVEVAQFTAWGFSPGMNNPKNHEAFVKEIKESCKIAHKLGCTRMTVVCGNDQKGMTQEEMHENVIAGLKLAAPIAERENIMLIIEPMNIRVDHPGHCLYGSEDAVRICREVNSPMVKINWDLYHMQISEGDLCGHLRDGFDQVGYIQIADHPGRYEPGTGEINYKRVFEELAALGYTGPIGVECSPAETETIATRRLKTLTK
jgi:hydroxypyruvate isomerase